MSEQAIALAVDDLVVRFGGLTAVNGVSLQVPVGRLVGLIGPNGAGKTTTFNACSGLVSAVSGSVTLLGTDVSGMGPAARARLGLGRTFQRMELYDRLSVEDNVAMGLEARIAGQRHLGVLASNRGERQAIREATERAIGRCGIGHLRARRAGLLTSGQRRLVELARALAGGFAVLLLDEPSSGLDPAETRAFGSILRDVVRDDGTAILLVEHDMALVTSVCDHAYVLDFGELIEQGPIDHVLSSPVVRAAYLGEGEVA